MLPGIEMEYYDGQAHDKFSPTATGNITVNGNGHGRIYYTYEESAGYSVRCASLYDKGYNDIWMRTLSGVVYFTVLDVHDCSALKNLECWRNRLTRLDVSGCIALTTLECIYNNQLTSLDVSSCTALMTLMCNDNQLTELDVSKNTVLTTLGCFNNQLTELDVSKNTALTKLNCSGNQLTDLDVSQNTALTSLVCFDNQLTTLDVSQNTALTTLYCYNNQLSALDVSKNTALTDLRCYDNQLTALNVGSNTGLTELWCENNHLSLSTLYGIYTQMEDLESFFANPQTDTLIVSSCRPWDLSSERLFGETETTYTLVDEEGNEIPAGAYTENDFVFQFNNPATYTLTLQNQDLLNNYMGYPNGIITFTWHIFVEESLTVSVAANNGAWGWATQTGNGSYAKDSSATVIATPKDGYRFVNWTKEGVAMILLAGYTIY
ncbi:MAG: leucine-rich repeat domain-containing protein, partial [Bacteroidales bacterium]|nr:leucine-rich repeat domain-containing protein [Bacteroidales bacterium]